MTTRRLHLWLATGLLAAGLLSACSLRVGVEPWERDVMAERSMSLNGGVDDLVDDHIYFSKEASTGGRGFGGGGCGCN